MSFSTSRSYENRLIHPIWFSPVGFPGSFTHCSTTLHDSAYSAFHCSPSAVGCFWKDGVGRGGLRSLFVFVPHPLPLPRVSHMWPHLCWKTSKRSSLARQRSAHRGSSQEAQEHLWGNSKFVFLSGSFLFHWSFTDLLPQWVYNTSMPLLTLWMQPVCPKLSHNYKGEWKFPSQHSQSFIVVQGHFWKLHFMFRNLN